MNTLCGYTRLAIDTFRRLHGRGEFLRAEDFLEFLKAARLKTIDVDYQETEFISATHLAAQRGDVVSLGRLIKAGANVNLLSADKTSPVSQTTPLMMACFNGHVETCELLLKHGADATIASPSGKNALYFALLMDFNSASLNGKDVNPCIMALFLHDPFLKHLGDEELMSVKQSLKNVINNTTDFLMDSSCLIDLLKKKKTMNQEVELAPTYRPDTL